MAAAQEMYAEYNGYGLLKFYYDDKKASRDGIVYDLQVDVSNFYPGYPPMPGNFFMEDQTWTEDVSFVVIDPSFDKARPTSAFYMFHDFENLKKIDGMEYLHTEKVTSMYGMFSECRSLTEVDLSHFDTSNVTDMESMFDHCFALEKLDLRNFDVSKVTKTCYMFRTCESLKLLDISGWNTQNVTDMSCMFENCEILASLDVSSFDTRNVENMDCMFANCYDLKTLDLRSFDMSNVSSANEMFSYCRQLSAIYCNDDWTSLDITESDDMFSYCSDLVGSGEGATCAFDDTYTDITCASPCTAKDSGYFTAKPVVGSADVNGDGRIDVADVNAVFKAIKEEEEE